MGGNKGGGVYEAFEHKFSGSVSAPTVNIKTQDSKLTEAIPNYNGCNQGQPICKFPCFTSSGKETTDEDYAEGCLYAMCGSRACNCEGFKTWMMSNGQTPCHEDDV